MGLIPPRLLAASWRILEATLAWWSRARPGSAWRVADGFAAGLRPRRRHCRGVEVGSARPQRTPMTMRPEAVEESIPSDVDTRVARVGEGKTSTCSPHINNFF